MCIRDRWCQDHKSEVDFTTPVNDVSYLNKTFKGGKGKGGVRDLDYDPRCFFDAVKQLQKNEVSKVFVVGSFNKANAKKIKALRKYKETKMIKEWTDKILKIAKDIKKGDIDPVNQIKFLWCPQISEVDDMGDWA